MNSSYGKQIAKGSSVAQAAQQAIQQGAGQAASAACVATGVGAAVAPLCGLVGGAIGKPLGKFIGHVIDDVGNWLSGLFGGKKPVYHLVNQDDAPKDPNNYFFLYSQIAQADYQLAVVYQHVIDGIGDMLKQAGLVPNPDAIAAAMQPALGLIPNNGVPGNFKYYYDAYFDSAHNPELTVTVPWVPPRFQPLAAAVQIKVTKATWNDHPDVQQAYAAQMQAIQSQQVAWGDKLNVEAGRQMALAGTDAVIARAYSEAAVDPPRGSVIQAGQAADLVKLWHALNGESGGVQYIRPAAVAPTRSMAPDAQATGLFAVALLLHGETDGVQFLRPFGSTKP